MRRVAALALYLAGCGRLAFDPRAGDAGLDDARPGDAPRPQYQLDAGECPPSYTFGATSCYRVVANPPVEPAWLEAEALCEADAIGAHLVVLDTAAEAALVDGLVPGNIMDSFVGLSDLVTEGVFLPVNGVPLGYNVWLAGQPDGGTASNCVSFYRDLTLHDSDCASTNDYVCEYDGIPAVPATWGQ